MNVWAGMLPFMGSQRVAHDWATTELNWWVPLVAQMVKRLPAMQETWVESLGQEDPLEKEMATHSSFLDWKIPWWKLKNAFQKAMSQRISRE